MAQKIKNTIDYEGNLIFDNSMPDGNPRKLLDSSKLFNMGWKPTVNIDEGLSKTYSWYLENI